MSEYRVEDIDIKAFSSLSRKEAIKRKIEVINRFDLEAIPASCLPDVHQTSYYFVSYSHKDFRKVYKDLFDLEEAGLAIWYDRGIPAGKNWRAIVNKFMAPFDCKGVIFYISENALQAPGVLDEMFYAARQNKPYIAIAMPFESDFIHNGESVKGKVFKIREMVDILLENGADISATRLRHIRKLFPDDVIYLPLPMDAGTKVEKIFSCIPEEPMFDYDADQKEVLCLNDPNAFTIQAKDFAFNPKAVPGMIPHFRLGNCCFANARNLEKITFPKGVRFFPSGTYAFYNCVNLREINGLIVHSWIQEGMFQNCHRLRSLETADFHPIFHINDSAFAGCHNLDFSFLREFRSIQKIGYDAFTECHTLRSLSLPSIIEIGPFAFSSCHGLTRADIGNPQKVGEGVFAGCESLMSISVSPDNETLVSIDGALYIKENYTLYSYPMGRKEIVLDERCMAIGAHVFSHLEKRTSLIIPEGIQFLGFQCCRSSKSLVEVSLPSTLAGIASGAFFGCSNLKRVRVNLTKQQTLEQLQCDDTAFQGLTLDCVECLDGTVPIANLKPLLDV